MILDSYDRSTEAAGRTSAIIYGVQSATVANQDLVFNAQVGVNITPTAWLTLRAGSATAGTAPLKLASSTLNTTAEVGACEFLSDDLYFTITTDAARQKVVLTSGLTSGKIPVATTNGRLTDGPTPLAGTKVYYVADSSEGAATRKLTFTNGILTSET